MSIDGLILSDDLRFARMLQHELSYMRISLEVITDRAQLHEAFGYKVILADLDFCANGLLGEVMGENVCADLQRPMDSSFENSILVIGWSRSDAPEAHPDFCRCSAFLRRPYLMSDLRYIISGYFSLDNIARESLLQVNRSVGYPSHISRLRGASEIKGRSESDVGDRRLVCDKDSMTALYGGMRFSLSEYEYKTLSLLCDKRGEVVTREEIAALLNFNSGNMGDVYICHLRKKIDNILGIKLITTVRGKGYTLK